MYTTLFTHRQDRFGMGSKVRTFVAIELPENVRTDIRKLQHAFTSYRFNIRWVKPLNMHLTIKFLGDVDPTEMENVGRTVAGTAAQYPMFHLVPRGVGVFPNIKRPRIIWTGISGQTDVLRSMQASVSLGLSGLGFETEKRPFRGHLTLGRVKSRIRPPDLADALRAQQNFVSQAFTVEHLVMFKSELHPSGPCYTILGKFPLGISTSSKPHIT